MNDTLCASQRALDLIARWEGLSLVPHTAPWGKPTIGIGHVLRPDEAHLTRITRREAKALFVKDVAHFERLVRHSIKVRLTQEQFDALVSFTFNVGKNGLLDVARTVNRKDFAAVPRILEVWSNIQTPLGLITLPGLLNRRHSEGELFALPSDVAVESLSHPFPRTTLRAWTQQSLQATQYTLKNTGFYNGPVDGVWNDALMDGLLAYSYQQGVAIGPEPLEGVSEAFYSVLMSTPTPKYF